MKKFHNRDEMYELLYSLFEEATPLKTDCGELCSANCCKGDSETGMLLFPGEKTTLSVTVKDGRRVAVCGGKCSRSERPLSCRIFPFFPIVNEKEKIEAVIDSRGYGICPMVAHCDEIRFSRKFIKNVEKAGKILSSDKECLDFLKDLTDEIYEESEIINKFKAEDKND